MTDRIWHKGPPPHVGWWNASVGKSENVWRWWDGRGWSCVAGSDWSARRVVRSAMTRALVGGGYPLQWTDFWPENARVPRIDPRKPQQEFRVSWEIDVTADSHQQAAEVALAVQRDPNSLATVFDVQGPRGFRRIDLTEEN